MKLPLMLATLAVGITTAQGQKIEPTSAPHTYLVGKEKSPIYRTAADTAKSTSFYLPAGSEVTTVGPFNARWMKVKRDGFYFITPTRMLAGYDPSGASVATTSSTMPVDPDTHRITYQGVIEVPGVTKDQLYSRALEWVAKTYNSAQAVIQMQDKESGKLVMKGLTRVNIRSYAGGVVTHTLSIYVKDGRYKYILTDLSHDAIAVQNVVSGGPLENDEAKVYGFGGGRKAWLDIRDQVSHDAQSIANRLQAAMTVKGGKDPSEF